jgi:hypothetical protein
MPHIPEQRRDGIDLSREGRNNAGECDGPGELNWALTEVVIGYLLAKGLSYRTCNDIVGALDNAKDEFRRLVQHPYEDRKIVENGNAYPKEVLS